MLPNGNITSLPGILLLDLIYTLYTTQKKRSDHSSRHCTDDMYQEKKCFGPICRLQAFHPFCVCVCFFFCLLEESTRPSSFSLKMQTFPRQINTEKASSKPDRKHQLGPGPAFILMVFISASLCVRSNNQAPRRTGTPLFNRLAAAMRGRTSHSPRLISSQERQEREEENKR